MTEEQANQIIGLLSDIKSDTGSVDTNTSYLDSKLGRIETLLEKVVKEIETLQTIVGDMNP